MTKNIGTTCVLSTQELVHLVELSRLVARSRQKRSATLTECLDVLIEWGAELVTGDESRFGNTRYSPAELSNPELEAFGLKVDKTRRKLQVSQILALPDKQRQAFLAFAADWEQARNAQVAQFSCSYTPSTSALEQLAAIHRRHQEHGSDYFASPGRAIRMLLRDHADEIKSRLQTTADSQSIDATFDRELSRLCLEEQIPAEDLALLELIQMVPVVPLWRADWALDLIVRALARVSMPSAIADADLKARTLEVLGAQCIVRSGAIRDSAQAFDAAFAALSENKSNFERTQSGANSWDEFLKSLERIMALVPTAWLKQQLAQTDHWERDQIKWSIEDGSLFFRLERIAQHLPSLP